LNIKHGRKEYNMDADVVITALGAAIEFLLEDGEGIIVDTCYGRFIVGSEDGYLVVNECKIDESPDVFKNAKAGTKVKLKGVVVSAPPPDLQQ
jgi:hypothetical protein